MVFRIKKIFILIVVLQIYSTLYGYTLGIYIHPYEIFNFGYDYNLQANLPQERISQKYDVGKWVTYSIFKYKYIYDISGNIVKFQSYNESTEYVRTYEYTYDINDDIVEIKIYDNHDDNFSTLKIYRENLHIIETLYINGNFDKSYEYKIDDNHRIYYIKNKIFNPFIEAVLDYFEIYITYKLENPREIDFIKKINYTAKGESSAENFSYEYSDFGYVRTESNGMIKKVNFKDNLLASIISYTPGGESLFINDYFTRDDQGRIIQILSVKSGSEDKPLEYSQGDTRSILSYE